jgi:hypothetical protein
MIWVWPAQKKKLLVTSRRFERLTFRKLQRNWNLTRYHCATKPVLLI